MMWRDIGPRENGIGELYAYLPQNATNVAAMLAVPPRSIQHPDYGFSVGRGAWRFETGKWTTVAERVRMNAVGVANGAFPLRIYALWRSWAEQRRKEADEPPYDTMHCGGYIRQTVF